MTTLIILGSIAALILILHLAAGKEMAIEKTITINKPVQQVFDYVKFTKNHDNFSVWNMMDPDMKKELIGTDATVGFIYKWDSAKDKNVGAGEQELKKIVENKSLEYELRFTRPMNGISMSKYYFTSVSANETNVKWGFYSPTKFPMTVLKPVFVKTLGNALQKGLENLKNILEK